MQTVFFIVRGKGRAYRFLLKITGNCPVTGESNFLCLRTLTMKRLLFLAIGLLLMGFVLSGLAPPGAGPYGALAQIRAGQATNRGDEVITITYYKADGKRVIRLYRHPRARRAPRTRATTSRKTTRPRRRRRKSQRRSMRRTVTITTSRPRTFMRAGSRPTWSI